MASKTLDEMFRLGAAVLGGRPQDFLDAKVLLLRAARIAETAFHSSPYAPVSPRAEAVFLRLIGKRRAGTPVPYLTGTKEFWSLPLEVTPSVLIPRPETEALVEKVLELSSREREVILDMGTGSGNIVIALARELPRARLLAADVSVRALNVAKRNAARQNVRRVEFVRSNLFSAFRNSELSFDFIVSNPPYVSREAWETLSPDVRRHEPRVALLAGESGLEIIRRLVGQASRFLSPCGYLILEIGDGQREAVLSFFGKQWTEIETAWDLAGKPRIITARKARSRRRGRGRQVPPR